MSAPGGSLPMAMCGTALLGCGRAKTVSCSRGECVRTQLPLCACVSGSNAASAVFQVRFPGEHSGRWFRPAPLLRCDLSRGGEPVVAGITESVARGRGGTAGEPPARRCVPVLLLSVAAGFLLTVGRSAQLVDRSVGGTITTSLPGRDPDATALTSAVSALASGAAGLLAACHVAVSASFAPAVAAVLLVPAGGASARLAARATAASGRPEARNAVTLRVADAFPLSYRNVRVLARREIPPGVRSLPGPRDARVPAGGRRIPYPAPG